MTTELGRLAAAHAELNARRELLDRAILGMGSMVELIDRIKPTLAGYDYAAGESEALDIIKATEGAARAERERIVAAIRKQAQAPALDVVIEVLDRIADALETGKL